MGEITTIKIKVEIEKNKTTMVKKLIEVITKQLFLPQFKDVNMISVKEWS